MKLHAMGETACGLAVELILKAADEIEWLRRELRRVEISHDEVNKMHDSLKKEIERLRADKEHLIELLEECSEDYNHPAFTDRHGMGPRLRAAIDAARRKEER